MERCSAISSQKPVDPHHPNHYKSLCENAAQRAKNGDASAYDVLRTLAASKVKEAYVPFANVLMTESQAYSKNPAEAVTFYIKAAELGIKEAYMPLGRACQSGTGIERNDIKAANYYHKAGQSDDANGYVALGELYRDGSGPEAVYKILPWPEKAIENFEKAANLGSMEGHIYLGEWYEQQHDFGKADTHYLKAIAFLSGVFINISDKAGTIVLVHNTEHAFNGYASDWVSQGLKFLDSDGPLSRKAFLCFDMAAKKGDKDGWEHLGAMYEKNRQGEAITCYRQAYNKGSTTAQAKLESLVHPPLFEKATKSGGWAWIQLGELLEKGDRVIPPNLLKAAECYKILLGTAFNEDASYSLAKIHAPDKLNDVEKMVNYYKEASETSHVAAQDLVKIYHDGSDGVPVDPVAALEYNVKALQFLNNSDYVRLKFSDHHQKAGKTVAEIRKNIRDVLTVKETESMKNNPVERVKCLEEASTFSPFAAKELAEKYQSGQGVTQNFGAALKYYGIALELSNRKYFSEGVRDTVTALSFWLQIKSTIRSLLRVQFINDDQSS